MNTTTMQAPVTREEPESWSDAIGKPTAESLVEMVAALECDYERLEELRDLREGYEIEDKRDGYTDAEAWAEAYPDEAAELAELESAAGDCENADDARQRIEEAPLSVEVRSGWHAPGADADAEEFCILLGTGGPATRIRGELNEYREPCRAWLEVQDWFKPWTQYFRIKQDTLLAYARCFYYGE